MALGIMAPVRNAELDAITTYASTTCKLRIYSGSRPATGGAITTLLAELLFAGAFAGAASAGVLTLGTINQDASNDATGTATWFRLFKSDGTTIIMDGDVGTSGSDLNLNSTSIVAAGTCSVTSFTITAGNP